MACTSVVGSSSSDDAVAVCNTSTRPIEYCWVSGFEVGQLSSKPASHSCNAHV